MILLQFCLITQLQILHLSINSFKTVGMIEIAKALQNVSGLTALNISNNNVSERAAGILLQFYLKIQNYKSCTLQITA